MSAVPSAAPHPPANVLEPLLAVERLSVAFPTRRGPMHAVHDVDLSVASGETLGLVGESGSGKSVTLRSLIRLLPASARIVSGQVRWNGEEILDWPQKRLERLRGSEVGMVFQDSMSALNPVFTVGNHLTEVLRVKGGMGRVAARREAVDLLQRVGIRHAATRLGAYPHEFSGGMRQRVMIALAIALRPRLLLADEPTTALDVTIQDQILALLREIQVETGMAMIFVSHDLGVIAQIADRTGVMYAGHILEAGATPDVLHVPRHPYTQGLLAALPRLAVRQKRLRPIPGQPPDLAAMPPGCPFAPRCPYARAACSGIAVTLDRADHGSACPFVATDVLPG